MASLNNIDDIIGFFRIILDTFGVDYGDLPSGLKALALCSIFGFLLLWTAEADDLSSSSPKRSSRKRVRSRSPSVIPIKKKRVVKRKVVPVERRTLAARRSVTSSSSDAPIGASSFASNLASRVPDTFDQVIGVSGERGEKEKNSSVRASLDERKEDLEDIEDVISEDL